jgi:hypothetical protein
MMRVEWVKCQGDEWCPLNTVDLNDPYFDNLEGIYVIWYGSEDGAWVRVGQGNIRERLLAHRYNPEIQRYADRGLRVTWAALAPQYHDGVEAYLTRSLSPLVGTRSPSATPIEVNRPGF